MMRFLFLALCLFIASCKGVADKDASSKKDTVVNSNDYKSLAVQEIGKDSLLYEANSDKTYMLCKSVEVPLHLPMTPAGGNAVPLDSNSGKIKLVVIKLADNKVVYEKSIAYGSAVWAGKEELRIVEVMGANTPENPNAYLYNLITKKITPISNKKSGEEKIDRH